MYKNKKNANIRNMKDYYKKSQKEFIKYIKENPYCTREDWDNYAHENCLFSSFTLSCHEITNSTLKTLQRQSINEFEFLKEKYIIIPKTKIKTLINKVRKVLNLKEKEQEINVKK